MTNTPSIQDIRTMIRITLTLIILVFAGHSLFAQIERVAIPSTTTPGKLSVARTKQDIVLTLPFWDDFSKGTPGPNGSYFHPDESKWKNSKPTWISSGIGLKAPTINVATFDGLDATGKAYNQNTTTQVPDYTDSLESHFINLSSITGVFRDSVYLSFFYQWQGNGETPDQQDYLEVQFRTATAWVTVLKLTADPQQRRDQFYYASVKVLGAQYYHDRFQFRLRSFGGQTGPYDTWNIDYVYLNNFRRENDNSFPDQAITFPPTGLLPDGYRSMPYYHFIQNPSGSQSMFGIYNLRNSPEPMTFQTRATFEQYVDGVRSVYSETSAEQNILSGSPVLPAFTHDTVRYNGIPNASDPVQFPLNADSVFLDVKVTLFTGDNRTKEGTRAEDYTYRYEPIDFRINDTLTQAYVLKDYYAYDDGQAEYAVKLISSGNVAAVKYELPDGLPIENALLVAFDFYFPAFGISSNQIVDFYVFAENETTPGTPGESLLRVSNVTLRTGRVNEFQRISFQPTLQIPGKIFFVGWRQPAQGTAFVGIDYSNDSSDKLFFNPGTGVVPDKNDWTAVTDIPGSLMIRPVFGVGVPDPTTGIEDEPQFGVYPNPSSGNITITGWIDEVSVTSVTGQSIETRVVRNGEYTQVGIHAQPGVYLLRCRKGKYTETHKLIIGR